MTATAITPNILILAGKRDGRLDPLAEKAGVTHKCRVPICGKPLLQWVLEDVNPAFPGRKVIISIHDPDVIADLPGVIELREAGRLVMSRSRDGIVESVEAAIADAGGDAAFPLLITTGDNVLVSADMLREVHASAMAIGAGAVPVLAVRESILAAHPEAQRRFYTFRDKAIANCNTYWIRDAASIRAAEAFRKGGQFIKAAGRIADAFGWMNLIGFRLGIWTLDGAFSRISKRLGVKILPHLLTDGAYAVDVDNQRTYDVAEFLLKKRKVT